MFLNKVDRNSVGFADIGSVLTQISVAHYKEHFVLIFIATLHLLLTGQNCMS